MTWRHSRRARKLRLALVEILGSTCANFDGTCAGGLEIDHVNGRDWEPRKMSSLGRVNRYIREYESGVALQVLCKSHNVRKQRTTEE